MLRNLLLCLLLFVINVISGFSQYGSQPIVGIYSGEMTPHAIVVPARIDKKGNHMSHYVQYNHNIEGSSPIFLHLPIGSDNLTLQLQPNTKFISPHLIVEKRHKDHATRTFYKDFTADTPQGRDGRRSRKKRETAVAPFCHYRGTVDGHENSKVAVSLCDGMAGVIVTPKHGEFWVEPMKETDSSSNGRKHVVFKRTTTVPENKKKKRKKKKKHEKNCGTRQPRRQTEMRVEWQHQTGKVKVKGRGKSRKSKWRRSISEERHVEALLVADTSMMRFHEDSYVETYLLTIMNMVSSLYQDPSIGNLVNIVVVNMILLEDEVDQEGLNITVNADATLESFCKWQALQNYDDDDHPNHHDVAILITREDICARQNAPCGTLGVAHVGGMCSKELSCNVNEDNGITLAHTITHELGHNFGMYHDTEKIGCSRRVGTTQHVMTPSFEADTVDIAWSPCSRRDITNFLDKGLGNCLEDEPMGHNFSYPELPAGAMYDAEYQCQLQFGSKGAEVCSPLPEICSRLWCVVDGVCTTMLKPAAPGTSCGKHMWCQNQQCLPIGDKPEPINGGWSDWSDWSTCSRTCGAGVTIQERFCNHPVPTFGGKFCIGERRRYKICNIEPCPEDSPSFRAVQCSSYDDTPFNGKKYKWVPYFDKADSCELYCADTDDTIIVPWGEAALDGTPCRVGTRDMCIKGICKHVGCDWVVDSEAKEDKCGICHGNGDQCVTLSGTYEKETGTGYQEVVTIPAGARNIYVEELESSKNYIGIGSETSEEFYLNGKLEITISGEYEIAGTPGLYDRDEETERVHIPGPTKEGIIVYVIYRGKYKNSGVSYNFTVPKAHTTTEQQYEWSFSDWSACSATCGTGTQRAQPVCKERTLGPVDEAHCSDQSRPDNKMRVCNAHPCPTRWWAGPWQLCPVTCGDPLLTHRKRTVLCVERADPEPKVLVPTPTLRPQSGIEYFETNGRKYGGQDLALPDADCEGQVKPSEKEPCPNISPCEHTFETSTESVHRFDNDFTDYQLGFDEQYHRKKYIPKPVTVAPRKPIPKKQKRRKKKERKKMKIGDPEEINAFFKRSHNYKHFGSNSLTYMHYNADGSKQDFIL